MFYNTSFPETHGNNEESTKELAPSLHITKPTLKWSWMAGALVIAAAIAIGIGVGIWRQREHSSHKSSTTIRCGARTDLISLWLTFLARRRRLSSMIHLWQLCLLRMATDSYFSRTILVSSDVRFVLNQTINGARARISMPARTGISIPTRTPKTIRRWQSLPLTNLEQWY